MSLHHDRGVGPAVIIRAAVDVLVFAPLGLGAKIVEDAPAAAKRTRQELSNARFIGRIAVDQGVAQLRTRLSESATQEPKPAPPPAPASIVSPVEVNAGNPEDLALPDYDTLPAIDIVAKLETLSASERSAIASYESSNRQRRTVLGKLAQLEKR
ncbi:MAG: hypothetical protein ACJA14_002211 [Ilumatobacter sp.]|jgi:hypothetical protein